MPCRSRTATPRRVSAPYAVGGIVLGQDRQGQTAATPFDEADLVVDDADAVVGDPPAPLEVEPPPPRADAGDAPALPGDDRAEQATGEVAVAARHITLVAPHEASLVAGADLREAAEPARFVDPLEVAHPCGAGEPLDPVADDRGDADAGRVVGDADHRFEQRPLAIAEAPPADLGLAQVGGEQHRLDRAGGGCGSPTVERAQAGAPSGDREADVAEPRAGVAARAGDRRFPGPVRGALGRAVSAGRGRQRQRQR